MTLWVFGYGSLLWNPGFTPVEQEIATLQGYARSFCMYSIHHRGTVEDPGLVLALDKVDGGVCDGMAMRIAPGEEESVLRDLRARELISSAYYEDRVMLDLQDGRRVEAVTYIIDPDHVQYCRLDLETQAQMIARAVGGRGPNWEYLFRTTRHLNDLGLEDADLNWLSARVRTLMG